MGLRDYESELKAAADPSRVRILKILEGGEMCVCQIIAMARAIGPMAICERNMTLPARRRPAAKR
jgi:DNA-binding transcriptional ArsR family regulator